jgi:transcriptional regulator with XRE-family HTH domain
MSKIGKNIRKIRVVKQLSQASFAQIFNLARPSVGAYEEGRAEPRIDTLVQIGQYFGLTIDDLLNKDLTINDLSRFDPLKRKNVPDPGPESSSTNTIVMNTTVISAENQVDYIHNLSNSALLDSLPKFHFPGIKVINARAFEAEGDAMAFDNKGILQGDLVICTHTLQRSAFPITGKVYVLVTENKILIRRYKSGDKKLIFHCDNPDWPAEEYNNKELLEIWQAEAVFSRSLAPPIWLKDRIEELEQKFVDLAEKIKNLEKDK